MHSSDPEHLEKKNTSISTIASTVYYGSREPKRSVIETDRIIYQMMEDSNAKDIVVPETDFIEEEKQVKETKRHGVLWRFRIILTSTVILLLVIATIVISEVTKKLT